MGEGRDVFAREGTAIALSSTCVFEVETTGADTNAGLFDAAGSSPGTDYTYGAGQATFSYTDLVVGATTTQLTSVARPFSSADNRNGLQTTGGTGFTVGVFEMVSESGVTATMDRSVGTAASSGGVGNLGGALASPGMASGQMVAGNDCYIKAGTYSITSASTNISGGCVSSVAGASSSNSTKWVGYQTTRGDGGTRPLLQASGISTFTIFACNNVNIRVENISVDGASLTGSKGIAGNNACQVYRCKVANCVVGGITISNAAAAVILCEITGCSINTAAANCSFYYCIAHDNSVSAFSTRGGSLCKGCIAYNNTGGSTVGFTSDANGGAQFVDCIAYFNGGAGFFINANASGSTLINCAAVKNGGYGFDASGAADNTCLYNCAGGFPNTSGNVDTANIPSGQQIGFVMLTVNPYDTAAIAAITDIASAFAAFLPNTAAGGGALLRGAGFIPYLDIGAVQHPDSPANNLVIRRQLVR